MQAITVKFLGPTNFSGSRWKATCAAGSVTVPYDYSVNMGEDNARLAADALCKKLGWTWDMLGGQMANGDYVFVFVR